MLPRLVDKLVNIGVSLIEATPNKIIVGTISLRLPWVNIVKITNKMIKLTRKNSKMNFGITWIYACFILFFATETTPLLTRL